jgi:hypothetical protein
MPSSPGYLAVEKICLVCEKPLTLKSDRDILRKNYCSHSCANHASGKAREFKSYNCVDCGNTFLCQVATAKRCEGCRANMDLQVARSYKHMDENPRKYFQHALYKKGRRENLTVDFLMEMLSAQNGKCAISKVELTFSKKFGAGRVNTNASLDQIVAGAGYTNDNVQIVCDIVNRMKSDMDMKELGFWCNKILKGSENVPE